MSFADPVANGDPVAVTGTAAGEMVFALGKEGGEDAVLHVKHRDVLVKGELKPSGRGGAEEFEDLANVQVVTGREGAEALGNKEVGGQGVGDVEREIAYHGEL